MGARDDAHHLERLGGGADLEQRRRAVDEAEGDVPREGEGEDGLEVCARDRERDALGARHHRRRRRLHRQHRALAEDLALREREEGLVLAVALEDHLDLASDQEVAVGARRALLDDDGPRREVLRREHFGDPVELLRGAAAAQRIARRVRRIAQ